MIHHTEQIVKRFGLCLFSFFIRCPRVCHPHVQSRQIGGRRGGQLTDISYYTTLYCQRYYYYCQKVVFYYDGEGEKIQRSDTCSVMCHV